MTQVVLVQSMNYDGESPIQQEKDCFHPKMDLKQETLQVVHSVYKFLF